MELKIIGYQFPEEKEGHDANWLTLSVKAKNKLGYWEKNCSCLLSWELKWIYEWFENILDNKIIEKKLTFLEPDLKFIYTSKQDNLYYLKINLRYGLSFYEHYPLSKNNCFIEITLNKKQIIQAIESFNNWNKTFRPREIIVQQVKNYFP